MAIKNSIRHRPLVDMTPMVDLGFLLVTFFMMTTQFTPMDPVQVAIPKSTADIKLPESNIITVLVSKDGGVYFRMDGKKNLKSLGKQLNSKWNLGLTEDELENFSSQANFGMPASGLKQFLELSEKEQKNTSMPGIPTESGNNELADWLIYSRITNQKASFVVKADKGTPFLPVINNVLNTLRDCNIYRFSLITDLEKTATL